MANISSIFKNDFAGNIGIALSGVFFQNSRDSGFPGGDSDMLLCATINGVNTPTMSRVTQSVYVEMYYPGEGVIWTVGTTVLSYYGGGTGQYGFKNLVISIRILKK